MTSNVAVIIGSLRQASYSRRIAQALHELAPAGMTLTELPHGDLPIYNGDLEANAPQPWERFRTGVQGFDAVLFVVPEYNRSIPGGVKNAIDVASKPNGKNLWVGKPSLVMAQSAGPLGGLAGSFALKQTLTGSGSVVMPHPEVYLGRVATLFDSDGPMVADTKEFLRGVLANFDTWISRFASR
ncbi:NADPH-dependent FMN reductase [Caenimonas aquaedulcis]|uniref:NAD(P)H-dependent oxidoreductase n=1 Tax=Caenimonas aquaedulcis TaxID=2793270 RepID=A0A931MJ14_9BURK|nr:NAD(P)H-dependent oxidoreductase [Caenimonas aquaedulcis]MBG9390424.1 NAD(P)H-dependent oxidoreductase [Caenimonas aquaedulcis]